ncbi:MAG: prenyltransferase [bacterium]
MRLKFWINNARHISLPQSVTPALLAVSMAAFHDGFSWLLALLAVIGVAFAHLGMNLADDYFDYKVGTGEKRVKMASDGIRARIAKYDYLTSGAATIAQLRTAIIVFLLIAIVCGVVIGYFRGTPIWILIAAGGLLGISYSGGPLKLGYHGLGELVIGTMFGPLLMIGTQYAASGVFDWNIIIVSCAAGLLVTNIVYSHSVMDKISDEKADKMTFARLLRTSKNELAASAIFNLLPFILIFTGVALNILNWSYLVVVILLPMAIKLWQSLRKFVTDDKEEIVLKFWMGPMGDFDAYREAGIEWFMLRWLLARNLVTFFSLIIIIINIISIFL